MTKQEMLPVKGTEAQSLALIQQDYMARFFRFIGSDSQKTIDSYTTAIRQFFSWMKREGISQPTNDDIYAWREWLKETPIEAGPRKGKKRKPSTIQNYITVIRIFFQWTEQERIYPNIAAHVKGAKLKKDHKKKAFTGAQARMILDDMPKESLVDLRNYAIMLLLFTGGLRRVEISRANIEDMTVEMGRSVLLIQGKGDLEKTKYVNLIPETEAAIRAYLKGRGKADSSEPLFVSHANGCKGKALSERTVSKIAKTSFRNAGFDDEMWTAHSTRHTAITLALMDEQENSLQQVQAFARHSSLDTTLIYAHNVNRLNSSCEASIGKAIFG